MVVYTGRLKKVNNKIGFVWLVNNIVKGAAGLSIQNDETFLQKKADTIIVDPPRSGMSKKAIKNLLSYKSERVIYISCSYINAIRDIKDMTGYKIESITPFDMFPKTHHTETVVVMSKVKE